MIADKRRLPMTNTERQRLDSARSQPTPERRPPAPQGGHRREDVDDPLPEDLEDDEEYDDEDIGRDQD